MRVLIVGFLLLATAAQAREAPEWTYCDFGVDPKAGLLASKAWMEAGMERGIAGSLYGNGRTAWLPQPRMDAATACATALASPDLPPQNWSRRVSLLQASAAHKIAADNYSGAMADLDAATAALPPGLDVAERTRTIDVTIAMLRALALAKAGNTAEAASLVVTAANARPWSGQLQDLAINILTTLPGGDAAAVPIADRRLRLDENGREPRARSRQASGDFTGALADWKRVRPAITEPTRITVPMRGIIVNGIQGWPISMVDPARVGAASLAAAFAGEPETACSWLAEGRTKASAAPAPIAPVLPKGITGPTFPTVDKAALDAAFAQQIALAEAAILHQSGKIAEAQSALAALGPIPNDPAALQAMSRILGQPAPKIDGATTIDPRRLFALLPRYEGPDAVAVASGNDALRGFLVGGLPSQKKPRRNSYSRSVGFFKDAGFKAKPVKTGPNAARGATTITFTGDATSAFAVEEMTLLRAAELALAAGKPGLLILEKRDYVRTSQMTMNGSAIGGATPAGYQTEVDVIYTDSLSLPAGDDRAIAAADIVAALAPLYRAP